jgi:Ca2+-binding RTX toxin-like protein
VQTTGEGRDQLIGIEDLGGSQFGDQLTAGKGKDAFVFDQNPSIDVYTGTHAIDTITDSSHAGRDAVLLRNLYFGRGRSTGAIDVTVFYV